MSQFSPNPTGSPEGAAARKPISRRRKAMFVAIIVLVLAVGQEIVCRLLFPIPEVENFNRIDYTRLNIYSPDVERARRQGLTNVIIQWENAVDGFSFEHTLNIYGFRGPDFPADPPPGRDRIVMVGDSFVEGCGAADDDTIAEQFRRIMADRQPTDVLNLGVDAANFPEYVKLVRDGVELLKPKCVFLFLCTNDLPAPAIGDELREPPPMYRRTNPAWPRSLKLLSRYLQGESIPRRFPSGPFPFFAPIPSPTNQLTHVNPAQGIDAKVLEAMQQGRANPWAMNVPAFHESVLRHDFSKGGSPREHLKVQREWCREANCKLVVVYIPLCTIANPIYIESQNKLGGPGYGKLAQLDDRHLAQQRHLREVTSQLQIPFLDTTNMFIEAERTKGRMFWPIDGHCNAQGYRILAEACADYWTAGKVPE